METGLKPALKVNDCFDLHRSIITACERLI